MARAISPDDAVLTAAWTEISRPVSITTTPEGAEVAIARYGPGVPNWTSLGVSPVSNVAVPRGTLRLRVQKAGFGPVEDCTDPTNSSQADALGRSFVLPTSASVPEGMVRVSRMPPGARLYMLPGADPIAIEFDSFWIDRFEVTNQQFKAFVDAGGYRRREFWTHPLVKGPQTLPWEQAIELFRDSTGRQGPSTWQAGSYPQGEADLPVRGVSWSRRRRMQHSQGKQLPTMAHWVAVAGSGFFTDTLPTANFGGAGPLPGTRGGGAPIRHDEPCRQRQGMGRQFRRW